MTPRPTATKEAGSLRAGPDTAPGASSSEPGSIGAASCPCCGATHTRPFFQCAGAPVFCNVLYDSAAAARAAPRADIDLHYCPCCGMIHNARFEPALVRYAEGYENSLYHSPRFRDYADALIAELATRYELAGKFIAEIGCGDGRFLRALCSATAARGVGFDPSAPADAADCERVGIRRALFTPGAMEKPACLVVSRHVLEHIHAPLGFLQSLRTTGAALFFEVPNALWTLREGGPWDIIYEHCSYFTPRSLAALFQRAGFEVHDVRPRYGGQFLTIDAEPAGSSRSLSPLPLSAPVPDDYPLIESFSTRASSACDHWRSALAHPGPRPVVVWGAGSKGVTFLCAVDPDASRIAAAVDLNPRKHNRFTPVTGHPVLPPEAIRAINPRTIIVMNPLYEAEIRRAAADLAPRARVIPV